MKHAILLQVLAKLRRDVGLTVVDTHAGAGLYDLSGPAASASGEAALGIARLMAEPNAPQVFAPLKAAVRTLNADGAVRLYPGSPWLCVQALRPGESYVGCEVRPDDHALLARNIGRVAEGRGVRATTLQRDGYAEAAARLKGREGGLTILIDPPFERGDEYAKVLETLALIGARPNTSALVWLPLKDLETFDAFLRGVGTLGLADVAVAEVRLRSLTNPMRMNGCALAMINAPNVLAEATAICAWVASCVGEADSVGQVFDLATL